MVAWRGEFVEANGDCLAEIHGGLAGISGDFDEAVAEGEVFTGEAALFRSEDESDSAFASEFGMDHWGQGGKRNDGLLGFAVSDGSGAEDEGAIGDGLS
jgi:hypothetical protein